MLYCGFMPQKNAIKTYLPHTYYHVYNRGVEKRITFVDDKDYQVFMRYFYEYLTPAKPVKLSGLLGDSSNKYYNYRRKNYADKIRLSAFSLMPNHFHFLLRQEDTSAMAEFLQSLMVRYSLYFNRRHQRVGALFQSRYKAVVIKDDEHFFAVERYILRNPLDLGLTEAQLKDYPYSSLKRSDLLNSPLF